MSTGSFMLRLALVVLASAGSVSYAQQKSPLPGDYPNKPIRIIVGPAGSGSEFATRLVAQGISSPLGQPVILENRANVTLATEIAAKAPPDGYTMRAAGSSAWIFPLLAKASYDMVRDFSPVSLLSREVNVLAVHPSVPVKSVKELISLVKAKPGALNYPSIAVGAPQHLGTELFKSMAGVNLVWIPYQGSAPAIIALIAGEVQVMISPLSSVAAHMKSGKIRVLAVTSVTPSVLAPGLPTVASDLPGFEVVGVFGIWTPAKTPQAIINRLNQEIVRVLNQPEVKERLLNVGIEVVGSSPEQFDSLIKSDLAIMGKVIKDAGIKLN